MTSPGVYLDPACFTEAWLNPGVSQVPAILSSTGLKGPPDSKPGDRETMWVATGHTGWPPATESVWTPAPLPAIVRVYDLDDPREILRVVGNQSGSAWTVIRGDQGSQVVPHAPGARMWPVISAAALAGRAQGTPAGTGLAAVRGTRTAPQTTAGTAENTLVALDIPGGEARPGAVYEAYAWGYLTPGVAWENGLGWGGSTVGTTPAGGISLAGAGADSRWRMHAWLSFHVDTFNPTGPATAAASTCMWVAVSNATNPAPTVRPYMHGPAQHNYVVETGLLVTFRLWARLSTAAGSITVLGGRAWRAA